jgi:F-type H+-transporting ATPase subunit g
MRPQLVARTARALGRRANSSKAIENPQVKQAVEQASALYNQGAAAVQRVAGPVGDKVGSLLGGEC